MSFHYRRGGRALTNVTVALDDRPTVLIGPNGAGKSTLMRLLTGQLTATTGRVTSNGRVGWSPQHAVALAGFTVDEQVRYASWLAGVSRTAAGDEATRALALTDLSGLAGRPATRLSGGELARLGIACALASAPDFLVLDEPTAALDPLARRSVTVVLRGLADQGIGLLVSSHTATDVGAPFTRLLVLHLGRIEFDGSVADFFTMRHASGVVADLARALHDR